MRYNFGTDMSWGAIIIQVILSIVCPFLLIPFWYIYARLKDTDAKSAVSVIYFLAIMFILITSPILAVLGIYSFGFQTTFEQYGFCFAISIFEIHMALLHLWKTQIRPKITSKPPKEHKSLADIDDQFLQVLISVLIMAFPFYFFYLLYHCGMDFFVTLFFFYGFALIYRAVK